MDESPRDEEREHNADHAEQHIGVVGDTGISRRAAGDVLRIVEQDAHALAEAETGDQEVVALESQRDGAEQKRYKPRKQRAKYDRDKEIHLELNGEDSRGIRAYRHKACVAKGEQSCEARQHRHTENGDDVDADHYHNALKIAADAQCVAERGVYIIK